MTLATPQPTMASYQQFLLQSKDTFLSSLCELDSFCRNELPSKDQKFLAIIFLLPLFITCLCHIISFHDVMVLRLDVIIYSLVASALTIALREEKFERKFLTSLVILNIFRVLADAAAYRLILLALIPWISETILEELGLLQNSKERGETNAKEDAEKTLREEAEKHAQADAKKAEEKDAAKLAKEANERAAQDRAKSDELARLAQEKARSDEQARLGEEKVKADQNTERARKAAEDEAAICPQERPAPTPPKPTKQEIHERKTVTLDYRQTMDIKGDRAYTYLIKKFHQHQNGTFFERDFTFTKNPNEDFLIKNKDILLAHENTHQIWTHEYHTAFDFSFPEDIKGKNVKWEIDTFLLYSALSRILDFGDETKVIFNHYNTVNDYSRKDVVIEGGHGDGIKVIILPGENQAYLVKYSLQIMYKYDAKENRYVDSIYCKGLVDFKMTPYIALKDVMKALPEKPSSPQRASVRNSVGSPKQPQ